jgi:sugar lactone lactonase YvrE
MMAGGIVALLAADAVCLAQAPNPYRPVRGLADGGGPSTPGGEWAKLPGGREMGPPASVHVDVDGESIWALIRCDETNPVPAARGGRFGLDCMYPDGKLKPHDTIYKFAPKGDVVKSFGAGMFIWPHGMHVDRDGNVWATDAAADDAVATAAKAGVKAGHFVRKFSPDGKVLMTLGEPGVAGNDDYHFRSPAGVVTAPNGDIFVADGHGSNNRIVKYTKDGKFIKAWGKTGYGPGEFRVAHCIGMDKRGRLFVCDRGNTRIQLFDQEGKHLATWHQFGMPSGLAFSVNDEDLIYVFDSESDNVDNPGFEQGIRIGDALNGWVKYFILDQGGNPATTTGSGAEFGTVDKFGNVFAGEPRPRVLRKFVKVR